MDAQTIERKKLYVKVEPPGEPIPINVEPFDITDATPTEAEIRVVVKGLKKWPIRRCLWHPSRTHKTIAEGCTGAEEKGIEGPGEKWAIFTKLIQTIWDRGEIPQQMAWMTVVRLPKGGVDYHGIGLLEPF